MVECFEYFQNTSFHGFTFVLSLQACLCISPFLALISSLTEVDADSYASHGGYL